MARLKLLPLGNKNKGLWVSGPREKTGGDFLRRNQAIHILRETELRSRNGTTADAAIAGAHSLTKFNDVRFQGDSTVLYRNAVSIDTGYDGTPLEFQASEPRTATDAEYLFVSGGGKLRKVDTTGTVTQWGISPPSSGDWGASIGGSEETDTAVTVFDPQEKTLIATTSFTGWGFAGDVEPALRLIPGFPTPSGTMICINSDEDDDEIQEES